MAAKKKAKKSKRAPAKAKKNVARRAPAKKAAKRKAKSARKPARKVSAKKTPAKKKAVKKTAAKTSRGGNGGYGEGNYKATQRFDKAQEGFVRAHKSDIPAMGKQAEAALKGPEGKDLMAAEEEARGHAAGEEP